MRLIVTAFLGTGLAIVMANLVYAFSRRRIAYGRVFTRILWAERQERSALFWGMVGLNLLVAGGLISMLLTDPASLFVS